MAGVRLYDIPVIWLFTYFSSKMLFDKIPYIFELLSMALVLVYTIAWLFCRASFSRAELQLLGLFAIFSVYVLINAQLQGTQGEFFRAAYEYVLYGCCFFAMAYLLPRTNTTRCVSAFLAWGVIIAVLSWIEYLTKSYLIADHAYNLMYDPNYGFRASVFSRSYLSHGTLLGILSLLSMGMFYLRKRWYWIAAAIVFYASILTTASRGPLVAAGLALIVQFWMNAYISVKHSKVRFGAMMLLTVGAVAVLAVMFGTFQTGNGTVDYFLFRIRSILNWQGDAGNVGRLQIWEQSLEWFKTNVLFGIGPSKTGSWKPDTLGVTESGVLKRLCELGILGAGCYYLFVASIFFQGVRKYRQICAGKKKEMLVWFGAAIMILINDCTLQITEEIAISFFMFAAFAGLVTVGEQE